MIYKVDVQTGDAVLIAEMDRGLRLRDGPVWAKDGKRFFYTAGIRSEEKRYVYTYDLKTGKNERLPGSPDDACFIAISSDGKWLALVNEQGKKVLRYRISLDGKDVEKTDLGLLWVRSLSSQPGRPLYRVPIHGHGPRTGRSLGHGEFPACRQGEEVVPYFFSLMRSSTLTSQIVPLGRVLMNSSV